MLLKCCSFFVLFFSWRINRFIFLCVGQLSQRMQLPGNMWSEVWQSARSVPASRQKRLFDDTKEAEKVSQQFYKNKIEFKRIKKYYIINSFADIFIIFEVAQWKAFFLFSACRPIFVFCFWSCVTSWARSQTELQYCLWLNNLMVNNGEMLELWEMWSTPSYCRHSQIPLWLGLVAPDRVLSLCQIELFDI